MNNVNILNLNFYYVRHGYSCANMKHDLSKSKDLGFVNHIKSKFDQIIVKDPNLSSYGINNCLIANKELKKLELTSDKIDFICSSPLVRAIETAYLMFVTDWSEFKKKIFI